MDDFARDLLGVLSADPGCVLAWCLLPNHYHALVETPDVMQLLQRLGRLHGRTSHTWNGEERTRGRQVFFRAVERAMRSDAHTFATLNYVHHNPVHHGYVARWTEWPWSSAPEYLEQTGEAEATRVWRSYPVRDYGKGWDDPDM
jgi:putative transposase